MKWKDRGVVFSLMAMQNNIWEEAEHPFTKETTSPNDHFWLRPFGGRIREFLLYHEFSFFHIYSKLVPGSP